MYIEDTARNIVTILQRELNDESRSYTDRMASVMSRGRYFNDLLVRQGLNTANMLRHLAKAGTEKQE